MVDQLIKAYKYSIVEEPMDYTPLRRVVAPDFADENDSPNDVGPGPMGY